MSENPPEETAVDYEQPPNFVDTDRPAETVATDAVGDAPNPPNDPVPDETEPVEDPSVCYIVYTDGNGNRNRIPREQYDKLGL